MAGLDVVDASSIGERLDFFACFVRRLYPSSGAACIPVRHAEDTPPEHASGNKVFALLNDQIEGFGFDLSSQL
ncbi:hypothetical protein BG74_09520 [Sodalis-like endosymbiont of Proechinophthirus fluctus]|nr:hypothetical protein BG74_09520 [Sodalis-like endosymbiont of Proechinophthirus fluctus]